MKRTVIAALATAGTALITTAPMLIPMIAPRASGPAPQPESAAGARTAASTLLGDFTARRYAAAWNLLAPADQQAIPLATWLGFYDRCAGRLTGYEIIAVELAGGDEAIAAADTLYQSGAMPVITGPAMLTFAYIGGAWRYLPDMAVWKHPDTAQDLAFARSYGVC